jgi:predicted HicB family RNase H-like nuclease
VPQKRKSGKKLGRPKLPTGTAKSGVLRLRVSDKETVRFEMAAKRDGQSLPAWVRKTLIDAS